MILSLVDLQEGQLIPQYYYVSNRNKLVNRIVIRSRLPLEVRDHTEHA